MGRIQTSWFGVCVGVAAACWLVAGGDLYATSLVWTNAASGTQYWGIAGNWSPNQTPVNDDTVSVTIATSGQTIEFKSSDTVSVAINTLSGSGSSTRKFLISGGVLTNNVLNVSQGNVTVEVGPAGAYKSNKRWILANAGSVLNVYGYCNPNDQCGGSGSSAAIVNIYSGGYLTSSYIYFDMIANLYPGGTTVTFSANPAAVGGKTTLYGGTIAGTFYAQVNGNIVVTGDVTCTGTLVDGNVINSRASNAGQYPTFDMNAGSFQAAAGVYMGYGFSATPGAVGTLNLNGGVWSPTTPRNLYMNIDYNGTYYGQRSIVNQRGGTNNFATIYVGYSGTAAAVTNGSYLMVTGGVLNAANIYLSSGGAGLGHNSDLAIYSGAINISSNLVLNRSYTNTLLNDVTISGGTITFSNANFVIRSLDEQTNVVLNGGTYRFQGLSNTLEAASADMGDPPLNYPVKWRDWQTNYALGNLELGASARLTLTNAVTNVTTAAKEAVYINALILGSNSTLNLNNLNLYYRTMTLGTGATYENGTPKTIPRGTFISIH